METDLRLTVDDVVAGYGKRRVLHGISLKVGVGEIVTILGHNGAGKTTLLKSVFGLVTPDSGTIRFDGSDVTGAASSDRVRLGVSYTPATSAIFRDLTVRENLELGAFTVSDAKVRAERLDRVHTLFPMLAERALTVAGRLSGGQQRLLSIGLALMSGARLLLLDEPSLGIAPGLVAELFETIRRLSVESGLSVLLVEQNVTAALPIADRVYYLRTGQMILTETAREASEREDWWALF